MDSIFVSSTFNNVLYFFLSCVSEAVLCFSGVFLFSLDVANFFMGSTGNHNE